MKGVRLYQFSTFLLVILLFGVLVYYNFDRLVNYAPKDGLFGVRGSVCDNPGRSGERYFAECMNNFENGCGNCVSCKHECVQECNDGAQQCGWNSEQINICRLGCEIQLEICIGDGEENCHDGRDDDNDGLVDCDDYDCINGGSCSERGNCADGIDNDGDGEFDCDDLDCFDDPVCDNGSGEY